MAQKNLYAQRDLGINGKAFKAGDVVAKIDTELPLDRLNGALVNGAVGEDKPEVEVAKEAKDAKPAAAPAPKA